MAKKLGSSKHPAVVRVQTTRRAQEILSVCNSNDWKAVVGVEPDEPEDIADVEKLLNPLTPSRNPVKVGRNDPCPCGSGRKYKKCCGSR
ncbi:MAG: SEC-C domain-containing protein [Rubrobacter sp.]|nr:SEC-C domain-containing protein [Rubrobacter sp.]